MWRITVLVVTASLCFYLPGYWVWWVNCIPATATVLWALHAFHEQSKHEFYLLFFLPISVFANLNGVSLWWVLCVGCVALCLLFCPQDVDERRGYGSKYIYSVPSHGDRAIDKSTRPLDSCATRPPAETPQKIVPSQSSYIPRSPTLPSTSFRVAAEPRLPRYTAPIYPSPAVVDTRRPLYAHIPRAEVDGMLLHASVSAKVDDRYLYDQHIRTDSAPYSATRSVIGVFKCFNCERRKNQSEEPCMWTSKGICVEIWMSSTGHRYRTRLSSQMCERCHIIVEPEVSNNDYVTKVVQVLDKWTGQHSHQYHHYIPHFILKTFANNFSLRTPNYIASISEISLSTALPPDWRPTGSGGRKKKGKRVNTRRGEHPIKVYQVEDQTIALNDAGRSYGVEHMYRDIQEDDCMRFEKLLSKMESTSSTFIRKIWTGEDLSLTRVQLAELKKFLAIMTYRSEHRRSEYYEDRFNQKTRKSIYNHMRHKNLTSIQEVWFDNLKWLIKTPTEEIMEEYQKAMLNMMDLGTREYKGPIHITELLDFGGACRNYMCIWQAEKGSEFIMSEGCFGSWEGDMSDPFHTFYVVSPRYCIVLVNRLDLWSPARYLPFRSWFEGDIHAFPETVYKKGLSPSTPDVNFFSPEDVFKYRRIIIPKDDVYFVNSIFLDARRKCLTYSSSASMYKTLRYYDMMKMIRPDLFKNGHDYSVLRRKLLASMNRTHTWDPPVSVFSR